MALEERIEALRADLRAAREFDGIRVRALRKLAGLSQKQLADIVGTGAFNIARWENGKANPTGEDATALEQVLAVIEEETKGES